MQLVRLQFSSALHCSGALQSSQQKRHKLQSRLSQAKHLAFWPQARRLRPCLLILAVQSPPADKVGALADGCRDQESVRGQDDAVLILGGADQPPALQSKPVSPHGPCHVSRAWSQVSNSSTGLQCRSLTPSTLPVDLTGSAEGVRQLNGCRPVAVAAARLGTKGEASVQDTASHTTQGQACSMERPAAHHLCTWCRLCLGGGRAHTVSTPTMRSCLASPGHQPAFSGIPQGLRGPPVGTSHHHSDT